MGNLNCNTNRCDSLMDNCNNCDLVTTTKPINEKEDDKNLYKDKHNDTISNNIVNIDYNHEINESSYLKTEELIFEKLYNNNDLKMNKPNNTIYKNRFSLSINKPKVLQYNTEKIKEGINDNEIDKCQEISISKTSYINQINKTINNSIIHSKPVNNNPYYTHRFSNSKFIDIKDSSKFILSYHNYEINSNDIYDDFGNKSYSNIINICNLDKNEITLIEKDAIYKGKVHYGSKEGEGILFFPKYNITYQGNFINDKFNGKGVLCNDEFIYKGNFKDNMKHNYGELLSFKGCYSYKGCWKFNKRNGVGEEIFENGIKYIGDYLNNNPHGNGKMMFSDGSYYEGEFNNGSFDGIGELVFKNLKCCKNIGSIDIKEYYDNNSNTSFSEEIILKKRKKQGKYRISNSSNVLPKMRTSFNYKNNNNKSFILNNYNNKMRSSSIIFRASNNNNAHHDLIISNKKSQLSRLSKLSKKSRTSLLLSNGDCKYIGEFKNNCFNGYGKLIKTNKVFFGVFANDKKMGLGMERNLSTNKVIIGIWKENKLSKDEHFLTEYNSNFNLYGDNDTSNTGVIKFSNIANAYDVHNINNRENYYINKGNDDKENFNNLNTKSCFNNNTLANANKANKNRNNDKAIMMKFFCKYFDQLEEEN